MYTVKLDMPNVGRGVEVELDGLGVFKNGSENEITKEQADSFRQRHATLVTETDDEGRVVNSYMENGPTVLQANWPVGVEVSTTESKKSDPESVKTKHEQPASVNPQKTKGDAGGSNTENQKGGDK